MDKEIHGRPIDGEEITTPIDVRIDLLLTAWLAQHTVDAESPDTWSDNLVKMVGAEIPENVDDVSLLRIILLLGDALDEVGLGADSVSRRIYDFAKNNAPHWEIDRNTEPYHVSLSDQNGGGYALYFDEQGQAEMGMGDEDEQEIL